MKTDAIIGDGCQPESVVDTIYTIDEAAEILKIKPRTVRAWIDQRIHEDDLQATIDKARKGK